MSPAQHKDRTMLTTFRLTTTPTPTDNDSSSENWHVLNCHLQAGKQGGRRVRQIVEGKFKLHFMLQLVHISWVTIRLLIKYVQFHL